MGKIKTVGDARELVEQNAEATIDRARPAFVTTNPRGEAKDMLRNFHYNYPFYGVVPAPRLAILMGTGADLPREIVLPDGTIYVTITCPRGVDTIVCFDGIPPTFASLVAGVEGRGILNPSDANGFLVYPTKALGIITRTAALVCITPYISTDAAALKNQ